MDTNLFVIFLTGLTIGGVTCMAVQGGLLASTIAARTNSGEKVSKVWPTLAFLTTKLFAYTILGFLLGTVGEAISLSDNTQTIIQLFAAIYMIAIGLNLLNVHPIFRYAVISPPKFLTRLVRKQSKSDELFAPALLGLMTILIPCGTTLAMEALAISSGSGLAGALIMGAFILGTSPLFLGLGVMTSVLGERFQEKFMKVAGVLVIYLALTSLNGALVLMDSPITFQKLAAASPVQVDFSGASAEEQKGQVASLSGKVENGVHVIDLNVMSGGYTPSYLVVKKDEPVKLNLVTNNVQSCARAFRIPALGISKNLKATGVETIEFTPNKVGKITFACSMGMYQGIIQVI